MNYETLSVGLADGVATVELNRPDKANAMNRAMWQEIRSAFRWVDETPEARVAVISGRGRGFTAGIDLAFIDELMKQSRGGCEGRANEALRRQILDLQG